MKRGDEISVEITDYAFGGRGIAKLETEHGHFVVFVDNTFPGQTVRVRIETKRKNYAEAKLIEVEKRP
jgi:predicted RNA-binding protein with TRAM domain